jgi:hypothetical protein
MNRYKALRDEPSYDAKKGDELELDLSEAEEQDMLVAKRLEIVSRQYKVIGASAVDGTDPDGTFESDMTLGREQLLVAGGHIERVEKPAPQKKGKEG